MEAVKAHPGFRISKYVRLVFDVVKGPLRASTTIPWAPVHALEYLASSREQQHVAPTASGLASVQSTVEQMASSSHEGPPIKDGKTA